MKSLAAGQSERKLRIFSQGSFCKTIAHTKHTHSRYFEVSLCDSQRKKKQNKTISRPRLRYFNLQLKCRIINKKIAGNLRLSLTATTLMKVVANTHTHKHTYIDFSLLLDFRFRIEKCATAKNQLKFRLKHDKWEERQEEEIEKKKH